MGFKRTKYRDGFTVHIYHDSENCIRCLQVSAFYARMKNKEPPWDTEDTKIIHNLCPASKYKIMGLVSFLTTCIHIQHVPFEEYENSSKNHVRLASIKLKNGDKICYFRETTLEEKIAVTKELTEPYPLYYTPKLRPRKLQKRTPKKSAPKPDFSYRGYRKVVKNAVKRRCIIKSAREANPDRTLKGRIIHCKKMRKAQKVKDLHKTRNPSSVTPKDKEPGKGTLKRKRWFLDKLKNNDGYEDDIFEEKNFYSFQNMLDEDEESNLSDVQNMVTPKWSFSLSPRERSESPTYEDCYSPEELSVSRKEAEEYQFRRFKRRKTMLLGDKNQVSSMKIKSESPDSTKILESVCKILMQHPKPEKDSDSDNSYFTDSSDDET